METCLIMPAFYEPFITLTHSLLQCDVSLWCFSDEEVDPYADRTCL